MYTISKRFFSFLLFLLFCGAVVSQNTDNNSDEIALIPVVDNDTIVPGSNSLKVEEKEESPVIVYSASPSEYEIADITVTGAENYEHSVLINYSNLKVGEKISIPGNEITTAVKRFWRQGMFSDVQITATKIEGNKIWLNIGLKTRPRINEITFHGLRKAEREDLEGAISLTKGNQISPDLMNRTSENIKKHFADKGFLNTEVSVTQKDAGKGNGSVDVDIQVEKNKKVKVAALQFTGNEQVPSQKLDKAMKKTNPRGKLYNFFRSKKYIKESYEEDKIALIDKYNELGFRDARIVKDTVYLTKPSRAKIEIDLSEGKKFYFRNITWIGNTLYSTALLNQALRIKKGDIYNTKKLDERLTLDDDAVGNLYLDNGYLFFHVEPIEVNVVGDSIDVEMRLYEGRQATIREVGITGNDRVYENVVRRELRTKPGQLFSKSDLVRSLRELAQMGHFDPEQLNPDIRPNAEEGTVDIFYPLTTKSSDQIETSVGWGSSGLIGSIGLKFSNFSIQNIFKPSTYKIVPQGDGQMLSLRAQTNASYYQSYGISFMEPWLSGRRPTSLSVSLNYSVQTGVSDRYFSGYQASENYYNQIMYGDNYANYYEYDEDKFIKTLGASVGVGTRLNWPDDYFTLYGAISYQHYNLQQWNYNFIMTDGRANNLSLNITFARNSINNPYFPTNGSSFSLSLNVTPPYSLFDGRDYSNPDMSDQERYEWVEYHKWSLKGRTFVPISRNEKLVLMARADFGFLGYFNKNKRSPFETFYMGGDGMSTGGYSSYAIETISMRGYENGSLTPMQADQGTQMANLYTKLSFELRYPIVSGGSTTVYALAFLDAGNAWYDFNEFNPFQLKRSAGVGLRVILPMIGLIGIDWGYGFDKIYSPIYPEGTDLLSGGRFSFVLGQEF